MARQAEGNKSGFYGCSLFLSKHQLTGFKKEMDVSLSYQITVEMHAYFPK